MMDNTSKEGMMQGHNVIGRPGAEQLNDEQLDTVVGGLITFLPSHPSDQPKFECRTVGSNAEHGSSVVAGKVQGSME